MAKFVPGIARLERNVFPLPVDYVPARAVEEPYLRGGTDFTVVDERKDPDRGVMYLCEIDDWRKCWIPASEVSFRRK